MQHLCLTVYDPLVQFCGPLHASLPAMIPDFGRVLQCKQTLDWSLVTQLGPSCTATLLNACCRQDPNAFFADSTNTLVTLLGGKALYDRLLPTEQTVYWGDGRLAGIVRQCMVLHALAPLSDKLSCIVTRVRNAAAGGRVDKTTILQTILGDTSIVTSLMGFMESPDTMRQLITCLKVLLEEGLGPGAGPDADPATDPPVAECGEAVPDALNTPGQFLKAVRNRRKPTARSHVSEMVSMLADLTSDNAKLESMSREIKQMQPSDLQSMMSEVTTMLGTGGPGGPGGPGSDLFRLLPSMLSSQ